MRDWPDTYRSRLIASHRALRVLVKNADPDTMRELAKDPEAVAELAAAMGKEDELLAALRDAGARI